MDTVSLNHLVRQCRDSHLDLVKLECPSTTAVCAIKLSNKLIIKCLAWIEGGGILIAVAVVSITGSTVDYRKEVEFVRQTNDAGEKDRVSVEIFHLVR